MNTKNFSPAYHLICQLKMSQQKGVDYSAVADGDPLANGQVPAVIRLQGGTVSAKVADLWSGLGLDPNDPMTVTDNSITTPSGFIDQTLTGDGVTTRTITRD